MTTAVPARPPTGSRGLLTPPLRAMTVGVVALVSLLAFESLAVGTAMPTVARSLDGIGLYAIAFGGPFASGVLAMVLSGLWCDSRGPRAPMWHGLGWFVAGLVIAGSASTMGYFVLGRVVQGFGSGLLSVALYVIVGRVYPEALHRRIFAVFAAAWAIPSMVGPAVAGLMVQYLGWRWVFLGVPLLAVPAMLLVQPGLRTIRTPQDGTGFPAAAAARVGWAAGAAVSAALLHHGGQQRGPLAVVLVVVALAGLLASTSRLLPPGFLRAARGLPSVIGLRGLASAAFVSAEVVIPLLLSRERGLSPTGAGLALTVGAVAWSGGAWVQGRVPEPRSRSTLPRLGMLCLAVGIGSVGTALVPAVPVPVGILGWGLAGLGMGLVYPSLSTLTLELSAPGEQGRNSSSLQLGDSLCAATVLALTGALFAAGADPGTATYLGALLVAALLALLGTLVAGRVVPASGGADTDGGTGGR
jgi:MFS family permease